VESNTYNFTQTLFNAGEKKEATWNEQIPQTHNYGMTWMVKWFTAGKTHT